MTLTVSKVTAVVAQWEHAIDPRDAGRCLLHGAACLIDFGAPCSLGAERAGHCATHRQPIAACRRMVDE